MDDDPLLGYGLRPVELADQTTVGDFFRSLTEPLSDYTFSQLFTWRNSLRILWKQIAGHLCVFANGAGDLTLLMPPIGDGGSAGDRALAEAFELMDAYNLARGVPDRSRVEYASDELLNRLDRSRLLVEPLGMDYVYDVQRMIDLAGGDLASKRQARNRFMRNYAHRVEAYDAARHIEGCRVLLDLWKHQQDVHHACDPSTNAIKRQKETVACDLALQGAGQLGLRGLVVYVTSPEGSESIRGFTFGEELGRDQSSIVIEKTDLQVKGLAQFIFSEFCRTHWSHRPLVNVGDDWGLESLAWTKMSYHPVRLLRKYVLRQPAKVRVAVHPQSPPAVAGEPQSHTPALATLVASASAPVAAVPSASGDAEITIRPARREDLGTALEIERACFNSYRLTKRQLQYLQSRPSVVFLVAEKGGRVVGEGIALVRQHKRGLLSGRIYSLAVSPECRGQKLGQRLLSGMIQHLSAKGVRRIYLEVEQANTAAERLYEQTGFRRIGTLPDYYGQGRHGLHMMRQTAPPAQLPSRTPASALATV